MKVTGYRFRRSAFVRGFMELADYGRRRGRRRRRLGLVAVLVPPVDPRLAAAGRHGLGQYVGKVHARYRRGIGRQTAAMAERRAVEGAVGGGGLKKLSGES